MTEKTYEEQYQEWRKLDKMFRFAWWSPRFLYRYFVSSRKLSRMVTEILSDFPEPRIRP